MRAEPIQILLVDDDEGDALLTRKALAKGTVPNEVRVATHGAEALAMLRKAAPHEEAPTPDVILLDLNMPVMDGFETLKEIRADADLKHLPVIVLTTSDADKDVLASYQMAANSYVTKPVGVADFMRMVEAVEEFWLQTVKLPRRPGR